MTGMNTVNMRAEEIYERAVHLKQFDTKKLRRRKYRIELAKELRLIYRLTENLRGNLYCCGFDSEHHQLACYMQEILFESIFLLMVKSKGYRVKLNARIWGFHNLPLAFFTHRPSTKISVEEAKRYYKNYN